MTYYQAQENETLAELIQRVRPGLSASQIWEHERNKSLHGSRSPQLLRTGDPVWIDDSTTNEPRWFSVRRGTSQKFVVNVEKRPFKVVLHFPNGEVVANQVFTLMLNGIELSGQTTEEGVLEVEVPVFATDGTVRVAGYAQALKIGGLEPLHTTRGIQGRLLNLGFLPGPIDGKIGPRTIAAIRAFQAYKGLRTDGVVGPQTRAAIAEAYGT